MPTPSSTFIRSLALATLALGGGVLAQAPKAIPVEDDPPIPKAIPVRPPPAPPAAPRTKGPEDDLFDFASLSYERQEWGLAAQNYAKYLQTYPAGKQVALALFRIGECYMQQRQLKQAASYYEEVVNRYPSSEGAPSAAYRLGAMAFNQAMNEAANGNKQAAIPGFETAAKYFNFSEARTTIPEAKLAAQYNKSRVYEQLGDTKKQIEALNAIVAVNDKTKNPYLETALLTLGSLQLASDKKGESLKAFEQLVKSSTDNAVVSDAALRAGVLYAEMNKPDEAVAMFQKALGLAETSEANRGIALVGIIQALNAKEDYDGVIDFYNRNAEVLPPGNVRPRMLLLVGHAYRQRKSYARAVEVYLIIEQYHKDTDEAFEAGYWKLYCFYLLNDKDLGEFANGFITRYTPTKGDHQFLSLARLIRADHFFNKGDFNQASLSYTDLKVEKLPEKLRPGTVFNMGWAQAEAGRHQEAVSSFTRFLNDYPGHEFTAKALARRGLANKDARDLPKAKADFEQVTRDFPQSDACEMAWLQLGFIAMETKDAKGTVTAFETLLKKFPQSKAAAQAHYGIGRGNFDQKLYDKAIPALRRSIELDGSLYMEKASQLLMLCDYARRNVADLSKTIDTYLGAKPEGIVPVEILTWLGGRHYNDQDFKKAARYLELACTPETPENTQPVVWLYLSMAQMHNGNWDQGVQAANNYLNTNPDPASKARALITKGRAQLGKGAFADADATAKEALAFVKDGKLQAELLILEGDIYVAEGDKLAAEGQQDAARAKWQAAGGKYAVPSQVFEDEEVTPEALHKAAIVLDKQGNTAQAEKLRAQLLQRYPKWKARG
ncbi:MAG: tetratricopeptide repeat protein [Verrucomicrobiaceae bacterium]|nr:tetratricopeptide repeat protein [Verrucomicrobiaceae bacterium]